MGRLSLRERLLVTGAASYGRVGGLLNRGILRGNELWAGVLARTLSPAAAAELGGRLYDRSLPPAGEGLFDWEEPWLAQRLPAAPARLLVGGAGTGRECAALAALGYTMDAFDPAPGAVAACASVLGDGGSARLGNYQDLCDGVLRGEGPLQGWLGQDYDAILLGWGSLTHVMVRAERRELLQACAQLSPRGPLLASFWLAGSRKPSRRTYDVGLRLGGLLNAGSPAWDAQDVRFLPHLGLGSSLRRDELQADAALAGYRVELETEGFPHATLLPPTG